MYVQIHDSERSGKRVLGVYSFFLLILELLSDSVVFSGGWGFPIFFHSYYKAVMFTNKSEFCLKYMIR